jgi:uncharacterized membrane protein YeaQ/YmgE (transglycosylase-associated protein family)
MKFWTAPATLLTTVISTTPAWAAANDATANEGAGFISWIVVGLVGGYLASRVINKTGEGLIRDIILGIIGGIIGGIIFRALGGHGVTGLNLWSILVAFVGAVVLLVVYHSLWGQRRA